MPDAKQPTAPADESAVDESLIDWMIGLSPEERLMHNDRMIQTIKELTDGFAAHRSNQPVGKARR